MLNFSINDPLTMGIVGESSVPDPGADVHIEASLVGAHYAEDLTGGVRRVSDTPAGDALLQNTWMTGPADFGSGSAKSWPQDWQIEVYWPTGDGKVGHAYGIWR